MPAVVWAGDLSDFGRALVDSGADNTLLPPRMARQLGVDLSACRPEGSTTAGGESSVLVHDGRFEVEIMGVTFSIVARFATDDDVPAILLGRSDFFATFRVSFDERARRFELTPY